MKRALLYVVLMSCTTLTFASTTINSLTDSIDLETFVTQLSEQYKRSSEGIYYHFKKEGVGRTPQKGDYVQLNYVAKLLDGTVFDQSQPNEPFLFQVGYRQVIRGLDAGIMLMPTGSKGTLYIPSNLAYGRFGVGETVPPNANLQFDIEILDIMDFEAYDKYMADLERKERLAFEKQQTQRFLEEKKLIQDYALNHKLKTKRTDTGLSYVISSKGKQENAKVGDKVTVAYEGFLLDNTSFDSGTYEFILGKGKVIEGWEEGLQFFNKGAEGWLLIPSSLAYGPRPIKEKAKGKTINIPANSVLVFKLEVIDITPIIK